MIQLVDPRGHLLSESTDASDTTDPSGATTGARLARRVRRPADLRKIGFLSNEPEHMTGPHFPGYTRVLESAFRERLGIDEFHSEVKPVLSRPAEAALIARFSGFQGVINGLAK